MWEIYLELSLAKPTREEYYLASVCATIESGYRKKPISIQDKLLKFTVKNPDLRDSKFSYEDLRRRKEEALNRVTSSGGIKVTRITRKPTEEEKRVIQILKERDNE